MSKAKKTPAVQETRQKLLDAAAEVFAELGYHRATIREITRRAGASLALVNYHFRDKAELYAELLRRLADDARNVIPGDEILTGPPDQQLRKFVGQFLHRALDPAKPQWRRQIFAREIAQPSAAFEIVLEMTRPLYERLGKIVTAIAGRTLPQRTVALHTASILGQCLYYIEHRAIIHALQPGLADYDHVAAICEHISASALAAIRGG